MRRRNFLKGLFAAYTCASTYFSFKYFKNNSTSSSDNSKFIERVEIPVVYHCNLNCAHCDHFASIAPKYIMPVEVYKKDVEQLAKITKGNVKELTLLGGEPLLHDNLPEIFKISRKYFPNSRIELLTNGTLLEKQPDSFWISAEKEDIGIYVSNYRTGKKLYDFDKICEKIDKFRTKIRISYPKLTFQLMNLTKDIQHKDIEKRYSKCYSKLWPILDNGKFYACSTLNGLDLFFNKKFPQYAIPIAKDDVLDIYKIKSIDELIDFYNKPKKMCAHCNYYISGKKDWAPSKREASEWYRG